MAKTSDATVHTHSGAVNLSSTRLAHPVRWNTRILDAWERAFWNLPRAKVPPFADFRSVADRVHELATLSHGVLWATDADLVQHSGVSETGVQRCLWLLEWAGLITRHHGSIAYWTHRAYGGTARRLGNYRVITVHAWRCQTAETSAEAEALAKTLRRPFSRSFGIPSRGGDVTSPTERGGDSGLMAVSPVTSDPAYLDALARYQEAEHTEADRVTISEHQGVKIEHLAKPGETAPFTRRWKREKALKTALERMPDH